MERHYNILKNHALELGFAAAVLSLLITEMFIFRTGHVFVGDYALYIRQAQSLLDGSQDKVFRDMAEMLSLSTYKYYSPTLYPWGFPLLLAVPTAVFGINYAVFKAVLCLCLLLTFYVLALDFRKIGEESTGAWVLLLFGLNFQTFAASDWVLSTLPFTLLVVLSLHLIHGFRICAGTLRERLLSGMVLGVVLFLAAETRTEGVLLLGALFFQCTMGERNDNGEKIQNTTEKRWKRLAGMVVTMAVPFAMVGVLCLLTWRVFPAGFMEHTSHLHGLTWDAVWENIRYYAGEGAAFCFSLSRSMGVFGQLFFWGFVLAGLFLGGRRRVADAAFLLLTLALLAVWPYRNTRYFIPMAPVALYYFVRGISALVQVAQLRKIHAVTVILAVCVCGQLYYQITDTLHFERRYSSIRPDVESPFSKAMLAYLNAHTKATDVIGCCESRTIYLYTGRISCNLFYSLDDTVQKADWYVCFRNRGNYLQHEPYELEEDAAHFRKVFENGDFTIYRCLPKSSQRDF